MIRRLVLTAGFAVLGAVAFAPKAHAQVSETVEFSGTVGSVCTLTNPVPGTLELVDPVNPTTLDSETNGTSGTVTVNCTGLNLITVAAPSNPVVPAGFTPDTLTAKVSEAGTELANDTGTSAAVTQGADVDLEVDMTVGSTTALPTGTYEYDVVVTATPN